MRRRVLIIAAILLALLVSVPTAAIWWLCYTQAGLHWLVARAENLPNTKMRFDGVEGRLADPILIRRFELEHERVRIVATDVRTQVELGAVMLQTIAVRELSLGRIEVELRRRTKPAIARAPRFMPSWLRLDAQSIKVAEARVLLVNGRTIEAAPLRAGARLTASRLHLENADVRSGPYRATGSLNVIAAVSTGLEGEVDWVVSLPEQPRYSGHVKVEGDLDELQIEGTVTRPFAATLAGTARELTGDWNWQARTRAERFDLTPWQPRSKLGPLAALIDGEGDRENLAIQGLVTPAELPTGPIQISLQGGIEGRRLLAESLLLKLPARGGELRARGSIEFDGGPPTVDLRGQWNKLGWPLDAPRVRSEAGTFALDGPMPYTFTVDGTVQAPRNIAARVRAQGDLDRSTVRASAFEVQALGGRLQGNGSVSWASERPWQARIAATGLNPAFAHQELDGSVSFLLAGSGQGFDADGRWQVDLSSVRGTVRSHPLSGRASVQRTGRNIRVRDTDLHYGSAQLVANGVYGRERDLHVELRAPDLSIVVPEARGNVDLSADLGGTEEEPRLGVQLRAAKIEYTRDQRRYVLGQLEARANVDLSDRERSFVRATAADLGVDERRLRSLRVTLDGQASAHDLLVNLDAGNAQLDLKTRSAFADRQWSGELQQLALTLGEVRMNLADPARFLASRERAELGSFCLTDGQRRACGQGRWQLDGPWLAVISADNVPLHLLAAGLPRRTEYSGVLGLEARAGGEPGKVWTADARVDIADGVLRYSRASGKVESFEIGTGSLQANATAEAITASASLKGSKTAALEANLRAVRTDTEWRNYPLSGKASASTSELGFIPVVLPEIDRASGELRADLGFGGTLGAPQIEGSLILERGEMDLYAVNLQLRDIGLRLDLRRNTLRLGARLRAGEGTAAVEGDLEWVERKPRGTLKFNGENLELVNVPEARIVASPALRFRMDGRRIDVDGAVRIPFAKLAPANLTGAKLPSEDEIVTGERATPPENRLMVETGVHVILGEEVTIDSYGLSGKLGGGVLVYSTSGEVSTGIGEITIVDGKYVLYTRELEIERGRLIFSGGPLSDPGVDLRAVKRLPDVVAGVNVRGTLRQPRLSFFSDPPLTQNQIASLLVTGRTLDSLQDGGTQNAGQTREALLAQGGALIAGRLGEQLGLKDLVIESDAENPSSLVLGTYLSPRLYVSYGVSLAESINTFKLRYTLGDRWTLKTEAGENRSADIVFTIDRGTASSPTAEPLVEPDR